MDYSIEVVKRVVAAKGKDLGTLTRRDRELRDKPP
jgi:hypothetical protein